MEERSELGLSWILTEATKQNGAFYEPQLTRWRKYLSWENPSSLWRPMAAKLLSHSHPLSSLSPLSKFRTSDFTLQHQPWLRRTPTPTRPKRLVVQVSLHDPISSSTALLHHLHTHQTPYSLFELAESTGYSLASYYTSLGLFVISVPGLWSLIKRSVKSKVPKLNSSPFWSLKNFIYLIINFGIMFFTILIPCLVLMIEDCGKEFGKKKHRKRIRYFQWKIWGNEN